MKLALYILKKAKDLTTAKLNFPDNVWNLIDLLFSMKHN